MKFLFLTIYVLCLLTYTTYANPIPDEAAPEEVSKDNVKKELDEKNVPKEVNTPSEKIEVSSAAETNPEGKEIETKKVKKPAEIRKESILSRTATKERKSPSVETKSPSVETKSPSVETKSPSVETNSPSVETKSPSVETKSPSVETKSPSVETKSPLVETKSPSVVTKIEAPSSNPSTMDIKSWGPKDYEYSFKTDNQRQAKAIHIEDKPEDKDNPYDVSDTGSYSTFNADNGYEYKVEYTAGSDGYRPKVSFSFHS